MADNGPLTDEHYEQLKQQLKLLDTAEMEIQRAERAGLDMTEQKKQAREARERMLKLKNAYWPGRP